ncbi:ParB/RepB/Spo0J family partition protein [Bdellovibrio sp.]|uniref:ParB/RepB/Spo0J family partition protein n=1 Tax=Bdellovibrio sp. TaxID=28201 RepID=UPI003221EF7C
MTNKNIKTVKIDQIRTSPLARQITVPNDTLMALRRDWLNGVIQNFPVVLPHEDGTYEVVVGGTRFLAAQLNFQQGQDPKFNGAKVEADMAALKQFIEIPVEIHPGFLSEKDKIEFMLRENLIRSELGKYDQFLQFDKLFDAVNKERSRRKEKSMTLNQFAEKYGPLFGLKKSSVYDLFELKHAKSIELEQLKSNRLAYSKLLVDIRDRKPKESQSSRASEKNSKFVSEEKLLNKANATLIDIKDVKSARNWRSVTDRIESDNQPTHTEKATLTESKESVKISSDTHKDQTVKQQQPETTKVNADTENQSIENFDVAKSEVTNGEFATSKTVEETITAQQIDSECLDVGSTKANDSDDDKGLEINSEGEMVAYIHAMRLIAELNQLITEQMDQNLFDRVSSSERGEMVDNCSKLIASLVQLKDVVGQENLLN